MTDRETIEATLKDYLSKQMPAGTEIGDPLWWAASIAKVVATALVQPEPNHLSDAMSVLADVNADLIKEAKLAQPEQDGFAPYTGKGEASKIKHSLEPMLGQEPTACGYDETVGMCTNNPCCEQTPIAHLWECIGRWSSYLALNGEKANLAPPEWLVDAVKAATVQPESQVCCGDYEKCMKPCTPRGRWLAENELAQPEQTPVAWMQDSIELYVNDRPTSIYKIPLYTAPPKREWVGLTNDEIQTQWNNACLDTVENPGWNRHIRFAQAIEFKLKELNL